MTRLWVASTLRAAVRALCLEKLGGIPSDGQQFHGATQMSFGLENGD